MKPEQERVKTVLIDTVALLCKNGLSYERELKIQAVIGVTVDEHDVFVVHINESFNPHGASSTSSSSAATAAETSMALVHVGPAGQQPKREFEAPRTPSSGVKRMRAESMPAMSPSSDMARQHARQQLRFASPAKSPSAGLPGHRVPAGVSTVPRGGVMRGPGSGRGGMRGAQRAAMGRGFPAGRSQRGVRMPRGSGRAAPRGGSVPRGRGGPRMQSFTPAQQSDNVIPTKHEMKFSPGNILAAAETVNSRMTPSFTAAESSVPFNFSPYFQPATAATTARHNQGSSAGGGGDLPSFSASDQGRFVNAAVAPGFGFDGVFAPDSSSAQSGSFADINPTLEFDFRPSFGASSAASGFMRSAGNAQPQSASTGNIKTESFADDVIFVDDDATDTEAATAAGESGSTSSVGPGDVMFEGSADVGDTGDGVPGGAVQQITRRVTITTNIQGQNVKYEQVCIATCAEFCLCRVITYNKEFFITCCLITFCDT